MCTNWKLQKQFYRYIEEVPQGSILGAIFNIFINDIFFFVEKSKLFNYADYNTVAFTHWVFETLINTLQSDSVSLINRFTVNKMKANPDQFQAIAIGKKQTKILFSILVI